MSYGKFLGTAFLTLFAITPSISSAESLSSMSKKFKFLAGEGVYGGLTFKPSMAMVGKADYETEALDGTATDATKNKEIKFNHGLASGSAFVGYKMDGPRLELEGSYSHFAKEKASTEKAVGFIDTYTGPGMTMYSVMGNVLYDFAMDKVSPYAGIGAGMDIINVDNSTAKRFAYQGKAGVSYAINPRAIVSFGVVYHGALGDTFTPNNANRATEATTAMSAITTAIASGAELANTAGIKELTPTGGSNKVTSAAATTARKTLAEAEPTASDTAVVKQAFKDKKEKGLKLIDDFINKNTPALLKMTTNYLGAEISVRFML